MLRKSAITLALKINGRPCTFNYVVLVLLHRGNADIMEIRAGRDCSTKLAQAIPHLLQEAGRHCVEKA